MNRGYSGKAVTVATSIKQQSTHNHSISAMSKKTDNVIVSINI